tara:strand:- start:386 stop:583 length:198 start_codon:yes stop_codon:yes gene_type:complete
MSNRELERKLLSKDQEIKELHVLVDTLQTNLRSALSYLDENQVKEIKRVPSMKWCVEWSPKDLDS